MIHGLFYTHVTLDKEGVDYSDVCIRRFTRHVKAVAFLPALPDPIVYSITPEVLIDIIHNATTAAEACRIIWRSLPADGLELPT